jgi:hypothetical protein
VKRVTILHTNNLQIVVLSWTNERLSAKPEEVVQQRSAFRNIDDMTKWFSFTPVLLPKRSPRSLKNN